MIIFILSLDKEGAVVYNALTDRQTVLRLVSRNNGSFCHATTAYGDACAIANRRNADAVAVFVVPTPDTAAGGGVGAFNSQPRRRPAAVAFLGQGTGDRGAPRGRVRRFRPHPSLARHLPPRRGRLLRAVRCVRWYLLTTEIPPAGAPPGGRGSTARRCLVVSLAPTPGVPLRSG